jgi:hypothetical protein
MRAHFFAVPFCLVALAAGAGQSPSYTDGYTLGCYNGGVWGGTPVPDVDPDATRMAQDADYARGYRDGVQQCYQSMQGTMGGRLGGGGR